jgi:uncharacterized protein YndB with AHSA1/START domain
MDAATVNEATVVGDSATVERTSDHELVVARTVNGPARIVFEAWTNADLLKQWWVPKSYPIKLLSCETDPRVGGRYRLVFAYEESTMEFFGRYLEVTPPSRLVWTNEEADNEQITTVTFEETDGATLVTVHELYPSKEALDEAISSGSAGIYAIPESLGQLEELLATMDASDWPATLPESPQGRWRRA